MRLTKPQVEALKAMPFEMAFWGPKRMYGWPGKFTEATVEAVVRRNLAIRQVSAMIHKYTLTRAGQDALAASNS